jgi:hypothetical protein
MKRASLAVGALGGLMLLLIGCKSFDLGLDMALSGADAAANVRLIDGSPDVVALDLQKTLKNTGYEAVIVKTDSTVVLETKSTAGLRFSLILKSQPSPNGREQTHVSMVWLDNRNDQQTSVKVFSEIDRQTGKK